MDILSELLRYLIILIIGIILVEWYATKKGWKKSFISSLLVIICWKTSMLFINFGMNILLDHFLTLIETDSILYQLYIIYPIMLVIQSLFINLVLGVIFFKLIYKQVVQESIVIILIIVVIEIIIESFILFSILIPLALIS